MATHPSDPAATDSSSVEDIPILEPGDRLSRDEFERRYNAMPNLKKAELIEGVVYMPSPVRFERHGEPHVHLTTWLGNYAAKTRGVRVGDNSTVRLDLDNEPQPDALLMIDPACGGQARISDDDYVENAPELVGEVTASTVSFDLGTKLNVYRRNGVREYIAWRVQDNEIDWFVLHGDKYDKITPSDSGVLCSETFPGLWLDPAALTSGDLAAVLSTLATGTSSSEHAAFLKRLSSS